MIDPRDPLGPVTRIIRQFGKHIQALAAILGSVTILFSDTIANGILAPTVILFNTILTDLVIVINELILSNLLVVNTVIGAVTVTALDVIANIDLTGTPLDIVIVLTGIATYAAISQHYPKYEGLAGTAIPLLVMLWFRLRDELNGLVW